MTELATMLTDELRARIDDLVKRAGEAMNSDTRVCFTLASEAHQLSMSAEYKYGLKKSLQCLAICRMNQADNHGAIDLLDQSIALNGAEADPLHKASCLYNQAIAYFNLADYPTALRYALTARSMIYEFGDQARAIGVSMFICNVLYVAYGDLQSAFDGYHELLEQCETHGDRLNGAGALSNIGMIYNQIGSTEFALDYYGRALQSFRELGLVRAEVIAGNDYAGILIDLGRLDEALESVTVTSALAEEHGLIQLHCSLLLKKAQIDSLKGHRSESIALLSLAEERLAEIKDAVPRLDLYLFSGRVSLQNGDSGEACRYFAKGLAYADQIGHKVGLAAMLKEYVTACEGVGDFETALALHKRSVEVEKEMFQENADRRLKTLEVRRVIRQAEVEAQALRHETQKLSDSQAALSRQASQDALTGVYNRRAMEEWLAIRFHDAIEMETPLILGLADIDHFKSVNDRFSHQTGDAVLSRVAQIVRAVCRDHDLVARYGGEEFALAFPETRLEDAEEVCERIRIEIEAYPWETVRAELRVTISIGLTGDLTLGSYEKMLGEADRQLYRAKREGRNRVCLSRPELENLALGRQIG